MSSKKTLVLFVTIGLTAFLFGTPWRVSAGGGHAEGNNCGPAGTWIGTNNFGSQFIVTISESGRGNDEFTVVADSVADDPRVGGAFPSAVRRTLQRGDAIRIGPNTYDTTLYAYATDASFEIAYHLVLSTTVVFTGDCDIGEVEGTVAFIAPEEDPFDSEVPALLCLPVTATYVRLPAVGPCGQ